jgi:hypothetical protein
MEMCRDNGNFDRKLQRDELLIFKKKIDKLQY